MSGYISEAEFSYSLAIFMKLKEINPKDIYPYLDINIKSYVKKSLKDLDTAEAINELKET